MKVRKAKIKHLEDIENLYSEQFKVAASLSPYFCQVGYQESDFIKNTIKSKDSQIYLLLDEKEVCGFILLQEKESSNFSFSIPHKFAYIMDILILPEYRGKGYGNILIDIAKKWARKRKLDYLSLDVLANNKNAINFYKKNDFKDKSLNMFLIL